MRWEPSEEYCRSATGPTTESQKENTTAQTQSGPTAERDNSTETQTEEPSQKQTQVHVPVATVDDDSERSAPVERNATDDSSESNSPHVVKAKNAERLEASSGAQAMTSETRHSHGTTTHGYGTRINCKCSSRECLGKDPSRSGRDLRRTRAR